MTQNQIIITHLFFGQNTFAIKFIFDKIDCKCGKKNKLSDTKSKFRNCNNFHNSYKVPILKYFSLYYRLSEQTIEIIAFWDNRRNPENLEL